MKQNAGRSTESVQATFYEGPAGQVSHDSSVLIQTGRRIFYFIAGNVGSADYDLLAYHIFQIMSDADEPFDMIFDMSGFAPSNDLPLPWVKRMLQICPPTILASVHVSTTPAVLIDHRLVQYQLSYQAEITKDRCRDLSAMR
jgi:neurofibromin 1